MKVVELDGRKLVSAETYHEYLKEQLEFPEEYGRNLDGLYDLLTEMAGPWEVVVFDSTFVDGRLRRVFNDAARENPGLRLRWIEKEDYESEKRN